MKYVIEEIFLPTYEKKLYGEYLTKELAENKGKELDKLKGRHFVIDTKEYSKTRTKKEYERFISYDETEECEMRKEYNKPFTMGYNPCGSCISWNVCEAKNKAKNQAM